MDFASPYYGLVDSERRKHTARVDRGATECMEGTLGHAGRGSECCCA
jgi:hypothetical protein